MAIIDAMDVRGLDLNLLIPLRVLLTERQVLGGDTAQQYLQQCLAGGEGGIGGCGVSPRIHRL